MPVKHGDYPAVIKGSISDQVDGFLVIPESASQWKKMDDFEGEVYRRECVQVYLTQSNTTYCCCECIPLGRRDGEVGGGQGMGFLVF